MTNIFAVKIGNVVNFGINGKLHKKNCGSASESDELYRLILKAKSDPTDANIKAIRIYMNEKTRIAMVAGLESDIDNGEVYLAGFNTPIPLPLVDTIKEYHENSYPLQGIINFWKLLMINPDKRVRNDLFDFIRIHDFVLTDTGYMLVYKAVDYKEKVDNDLLEFVTNQYLKVKKDWKCSPNKYMVYLDANGKYQMTKTSTAEGWGETELGIDFIGKLGDLNAKLDTLETETIYTDRHTHTMSIRLGKPVQMERKDCDGDAKLDCSYGLHVGATSYVNRFAQSCDAVLVCLVNPAHVVAVPSNEHSKMRVSEYFPIALASYTNSKIDIVEQKYFESDYKTYEEQELNEMILRVKASELPIETAIKSEPEARPMVELLKMLETRVFDLYEK